MSSGVNGLRAADADETIVSMVAAVRMSLMMGRSQRGLFIRLCFVSSFLFFLGRYE